MSDSRDSDGTALATLLILAMLLAVIFGGGAFYFWQRQTVLRQEVLARQAMAEEARARAMAEQRRLAAATQAQAEQRGGPTAAQSEEVSRDTGAMHQDAESVAESVRAVLDAQKEAWNAGDVDLFMQHYWNSDQLTFSSGGNVTRGWQATLDRYRQRYPSKNEMGQLDFQNLEVTPLGPEAALVLGQWHLRRTEDELGGVFTLVFRLVDGKWVIVHDHTSRAEAP